MPPSPPVTPADRKRTLAGLDTSARRIAAALMDSFEGWHAGTLVVLRQYALSCGRLETIADDAERRREQRANLALLKALDLQP